MKSLSDSREAAALVARVRRIRPDSARLWGRMTAPQMVCHLSDSFRAVMGLHAVSPASNAFSRTVMRFVALHVPLTWPHGVPTRPEVDQEAGGTPPDVFARDLEDLAALIARFTAPRRDFQPQPHPTFGPLSDAEWSRWAYLHVDHHLRQFGL